MPRPKPAIRIIPVYHPEYTAQTVEKLARILEQAKNGQRPRKGVNP